MEARPTPQQQYQPQAPSVAELLDSMHGAARALSDSIKLLNQRGIGVSIQPAPEGSDRLIQLVFTC